MIVSAESLPRQLNEGRERDIPEEGRLKQMWEQVATTLYKVKASTAVVVRFEVQANEAMADVPDPALQEGFAKLWTLLPSFVEAMEKHLKNAKMELREERMLQALTNRQQPREQQGIAQDSFAARRPPRQMGPTGRQAMDQGQGCREWDGQRCKRQEEQGTCYFAHTHTRGSCTEAYARRYPRSAAAQNLQQRR